MMKNRATASLRVPLWESVGSKLIEFARKYAVHEVAVVCLAGVGYLYVERTALLNRLAIAERQVEFTRAQSDLRMATLQQMLDMERQHTGQVVKQYEIEISIVTAQKELAIARIASR
jgi:hypothetical protein